MAELEDPTRRTFTCSMLAAAATLAACEEGAPPGVPPMNIRDLRVGLPLPLTYPEGHSGFVIKLGTPLPTGVGPDGDIVAYHSACPHMGCTLTQIDAEAGTLGPCACHSSLFDLRRDGVQIYGRATQNLVRVRLVVDDDGTITPVGLTGQPYGEALDPRWGP